MRRAFSGSTYYFYIKKIYLIFNASWQDDACPSRFRQWT
jgi:hypothetical protein